MNSSLPSLGIDIAKASFVAALRLDQDRILTHTFDNHKGGFAKLRIWLHQNFSGRVHAGLEATGHYGRPLLEWLHQEGHTVSLINPAKILAYATSVGRRNKTDPVDARIIAAFVAERHPDAWIPPSAEQQDLQSLTRLRAQLTAQCQQLRNQWHAAPTLSQVYLQNLIDAFKEQIDAVEKAIDALVKNHASLASAVDLLLTIPAIGKRTATTVLAELPTINSQSDARSLCAWAGLVPCRHQSGNREGPSRLSKMGNHYLLQALFMPALVAKRYNPVLNSFAQRLKKENKSHRSILGAISHKLLRIIIGVLRHNTPFNPNWPSS